MRQAEQLISVGSMAGETVASILRDAGLDHLEALAPDEVEANEERRRTWNKQRIASLQVRGADAGHAEAVVRGEIRRGGPFAASARTHDLALRWLRSGLRLLLLWGDKGRGKSLATAALLDRVPEGKAIPSDLLCSDGWWLKDGARSRVTGFTRDDLLRLPLLVIDDVGQETGERGAFHVAEALTTILPFRCKAAGLLTVITTNLLVSSEEVERRAAASQKHAAEIRASSWSAWLGHRAELIQARITEFGAVVQARGPDLREVLAEERKGARRAR